MALSRTVTCNLADQHERRNFRQMDTSGTHCIEMVARGGIEPPTRGFSVPRPKRLNFLIRLGFLKSNHGIFCAVMPR
jgi:hypothetical protein